MTSALLPVEFTAPLTRPVHPLGLDAATAWIETTTPDEARRWLPEGVQFRLTSSHHGPTSAFGVWGAPWCVDPDDLDPEDDLKTGPAVEDDDPDPFEAQTVWASNRLQNCGNLSPLDRAQAIEIAQQTFALREPLAVETQFATRLLADAPTPTAVDNLVTAVAHLEEAFAATGTVGLVHARVSMLAVAEDRRMIVRDPATPGVLRTPAGHRWVFGAGYATPLGDTLIGTSQTYGWRDEIKTREAIQHTLNQFVVIAERSVIVGYEAVMGAAEITP
ncbi:hypothetical protein [Mycolicibacterium hippocampi]|uniref:Uncharacterized protein n=1 Tax=Mycolicibacterium hippocampi TaxID=659824 RepID=A0A850PN19_9MYCO|nr:hypothetical protein [Mycolicibacterium hippocampi]NVN51699.1 hypothetical protein [Mycolicibacterium hippocampi]